MSMVPLPLDSSATVEPQGTDQQLPEKSSFLMWRDKQGLKGFAIPCVPQRR